MNTDILTLYAPQIIAAVTGVAVLLLGANIGQAIAACFRKTDMADLEGTLEAVRQQAVDERAKREQADTMNEALLDEVSATRRCVDSLRDELGELRGVNDTLKIHNDAMTAERANLYRRNAKGHFEAVVPKKPKPHTLKHGMTVKNPSEYQAKRIFAEAKRAGIIMWWDGSVNEHYPNIYYGKFGDTEFASSCIPNGPLSTTYISARQFRRRIRGEQE
jgi:hypothetical protein